MSSLSTQVLPQIPGLCRTVEFEYPLTTEGKVRPLSPNVQLYQNITVSCVYQTERACGCAASGWDMLWSFFMNLSRNTQSHRLVLLYFHATVILYNNMSELLGKRGIYHAVFLGKVIFLNHPIGKKSHKQIWQSSWCLCFCILGSLITRSLFSNNLTIFIITNQQLKLGYQSLGIIY